MRILIFLDYFTPAFRAGGPIRIFEAVAQAARPDREVFIATMNRDWGVETPFSEVAHDQWLPFAQAQVRYATDRARGGSHLRMLIKQTRADAIHLNSVFSRTWTMKVLLLRRFGLLPRARYFLSPHGELAAAALGLKAGRKNIFLKIARVLRLFQGIHWIATTEKERHEILTVVGKNARVKIVPPPFPPSFPHSPQPKQSGRLRLVFFARLSGMKNIGFLAQVFPHLRGEIDFDIYGPIDRDFEAAWPQTLEQLKAGFPGSITYRGAAPAVESAHILANYDLFVQPSLSENFGYSILEAMASGTPALISDRTPWNEITAMGAGHALPLEDASAWIQVLQKFIDMSEIDWRSSSKAATEWIRQRSADSQLLKAYEP